MSTIDAAIIKALVEHVGGDSSGIPDGTIGGKTYTAGDGINIVNDQISVEYDANTMEIKNGALAAKTQLTTGDGLTTSNGKLIANLDTNTMQMSGGKISAKTQLAAGNGISIASGKVNVNYDEDTMEIKDGKLAAKSSQGGYNIEGVTFNSSQSGFTGFTANNTPSIIKFKCTNFYGTNKDVTFITFIPDPSNVANQITLSDLYYKTTTDISFNGSLYKIFISNLDDKTWSLTGYDSVDGEIMYFLLKHIEASCKN